jgi:L-aspartate oxidase
LRIKLRSANFSDEPRAFGVVVVGGGVAGLTAALQASIETEVLVVSKAPVASSNSWQAQGGVAAAVGEGDSVALHAADTYRAGRSLCRPSAVERLTEEAPARIADLVELGVAFDQDLGREGGHSVRRVVHAGGAETGKAISEVLARHVRSNPRIVVADDVRVLDLWVSRGHCHGVLTDRGSVAAPATILATGGYAALWERTTNPPGTTGEGLVLAYRAGAAVADLEFVQFHPTALLDDGFLLSEALRGEGAMLLDDQGERFTDELAPRDVVARAIAERGQAGLDLRAIERSRFPALMTTLEEAGYDPAREPIPVSPAAHYTVGGVVTDLSGATTVRGLYAAGECAATGVHGANRLASNSLLECLVFGRRAGLAALAQPAVPARRPPATVPVGTQITPGLRHELWEEAGLMRSAEGLERLLHARALLPRLVAEGALARRESRGAHFRTDFPTEDPAFEGHIVLRRDHEPALERWS